MGILQSISSPLKCANIPVIFTIGNLNSTLSNSNTSYPSPYGKYYKSAKTQVLILASEIINMGYKPNDIITGIGLDVTNTNNLGLLKLFYIKIKETSANNIFTNYETNLYNNFAKQDYTPNNGFNLHNTLGYLWKGGNLIVEFGHNVIPDAFTRNASLKYTTTSFNSVIYSFSDSVDQEFILTGNNSTYRPNLAIKVGGILPPKPVISLKSNYQQIYTEENINLIPFTITSGPINSYTLNGILPTGVLFNTNTGIISGRSLTQLTVNLSIVANNYTVSSEPVSFTLTFNESNSIIYIGNYNTTLSIATSGYPYGKLYKSGKIQVLILASELTTMGFKLNDIISQIGLDVTNTTNVGLLKLFYIKIKETSANIISTNYETNLYNNFAKQNYTPNNGFNLHNTFGYLWKGGNLIVEFGHNVIPDASTNNASLKYTTTSFNSVIYSFSNSVDQEFILTGTTSTNRPNITIKVGGILPPKPVISLKSNYQQIYTDENINLIPFTISSGPITSYTLNGILPTGVLFNTNTGIISGRSLTQLAVNLSIVANNYTVSSEPVSFTLTFNESNSIIYIGNYNTTLSIATSGYPYGKLYKSGKIQILILASELTTMGFKLNDIISQIGLDVTNTTNVGLLKLFYIKIKETSANIISTNYETNLYNNFAKQNYTPNNGFNLHNTLGYLWKGGNLIVEFGHNVIPDAYTSNASLKYTTTSFNSVIYSFSNSVDQEFILTGNNSTNRPNIAIKIGGSLPPIPVISLKTDNKLIYTDENINLIPFTIVSGNITSYTLLGTLPTGILFNTTTGTISGRSFFSTTVNLSIVANNYTVSSDPVSFTLTFNESNLAIYIGNSNSMSSNTATGFPSPYGNYYWGAKHQILVLASEIIANGGVLNKTLNSISFDVINKNNCPTLNNFKIKIANVTFNSISSTTFTNDLTTIYGPENYTPINGINTHLITNNFIWDGNNLLIEIVFNNSSYLNDGNASHKNTSTSFNSCLYYISDILTVEAQLTGIIAPIRPNILLKFNTTGLSLNTTGLSFKIYNGFMNYNTNYFKNTVPITGETGIANNFTNINTATNGIVPINNSREQYSVEWIGNFTPTETGTWTFTMSGEDTSYIWLGDNATTAYNLSNTSLSVAYGTNSFTIPLTAGTIYPIRIQYGEHSAIEYMSLAVKTPSNITYSNIIPFLSS